MKRFTFLIDNAACTSISYPILLNVRETASGIQGSRPIVEIWYQK